MNYAQLLIPDFSLILCGYLVCRFTALDRTVWEQIDKLVYYFLFPVLLFHSIVRRPIDMGASTDFLAAALALLAGIIACSYALAYLPHMDKKLQTGSAQIGFRFNSFLALAVSERLGGAQGAQLMAILMGVGIPICNAAAVWWMARSSPEPFWQSIVRNPFVIATVGGLIANVAGFAIPSWMEPTVNRVGQAALGMGLMAVGAGMQMTQLGAHKVLTLSLLGIRHFVAPILAAGLAWAFGLSTLQTTVLLVFGASPTSANAYVLAARMGYNGAYVATLATTSTLLAMLSLPFALGVLR